MTTYRLASCPLTMYNHCLLLGTDQEHKNHKSGLSISSTHSSVSIIEASRDNACKSRLTFRYNERRKGVSGRCESARRDNERENETYDFDGRNLRSTPSHLSALHSFNDLVPHTRDKDLLLLGVCANCDGSEEPPDWFVVEIGLRSKCVDGLVLSDPERYRGSHASGREHWEKRG